MAGRKLAVRTRVKASTILEVVISMVIIVLVFGIAMMIYANVVRMSLSVRKMKAETIMQGLMLQAEQVKDVANQSTTVDDLRIEQEVKPFQGDTLLKEIHLTAFDANQSKIAELQKVIVKK